jgi:hypothetical protein
MGRGKIKIKIKIKNRIDSSVGHFVAIDICRKEFGLSQGLQN